MPIQNQDQLRQLIEKAHTILLPLPKAASVDTLSSVLSLHLWLTAIGKQSEIHSEQEDFGKLGFLPGINQIDHNVTFAQSFTVSVDMTNVPIEEVSYEAINPQTLEINLVSKKGQLTKDNLTIIAKPKLFDLIICIRTPTLDAYGALYTQNADVFFNSPKITIDNSVKNTNYGTVNSSNITTASCAELVFELMQETGFEITEDIATTLLTGILGETNSFQKPQTTPESFSRAAALIDLGGRYQEVIQHLFKTKELEVIKLWGRAMARIQAMPEYGLVYSVLSMQDIERSGINMEQLPLVMQECITNIADPNILILAYETEQGMQSYLYTNPNLKGTELVHALGGEYIDESIAHVGLPDVTAQTIDGYIKEMIEAQKDRIGLHVA